MYRLRLCQNEARPLAPLPLGLPDPRPNRFGDVEEGTTSNYAVSSVLEIIGAQFPWLSRLVIGVVPNLMLENARCARGHVILAAPG